MQHIKKQNTENEYTDNFQKNLKKIFRKISGTTVLEEATMW